MYYSETLRVWLYVWFQNVSHSYLIIFKYQKYPTFAWDFIAEFIYWYFDFISACDFISFNWDT